jgi:hypothetical protein
LISQTKTEMAKTGRHIKLDKEPSESSTKGAKQGEGRKTYLVDLDLAAKIDQVAYIERKTVKEVINEMMSNYIKSYEKKNGPIEPTPEK